MLIALMRKDRDGLRVEIVPNPDALPPKPKRTIELTPAQVQLIESLSQDLGKQVALQTLLDAIASASYSEGDGDGHFQAVMEH